MTDQQPTSATRGTLPIQTRIQFSAHIQSLDLWSGSTPALTVKVEYDEGDREKAINLLQGVVDAARAETKAPEPPSQIVGAHFSGTSEDLVEEIERRTRTGRIPR